MPDADTDLVLERLIPISPEQAWAGWTDPALLVQWFTPAPWKTIAAEVDLRPGGAFHTVMQSPDGQEFANTSCFLEVMPHSRLVWTSLLSGNYRPKPPAADVPDFTCVLTFSQLGGETLYRATAIHATSAAAKAHADMGFHPGWGAALDQLVALMQR